MAESSIGLAASRIIDGSVQLYGHQLEQVSDTMSPRVRNDWTLTWVWHPPGLGINVFEAEPGPKGAVAWLDSNGNVLAHQQIWQDPARISAPGAAGFVWRSSVDDLPPVGNSGNGGSNDSNSMGETVVQSATSTTGKRAFAGVSAVGVAALFLNSLF